MDKYLQLRTTDAGQIRDIAYGLCQRLQACGAVEVSFEDGDVLQCTYMVGSSGNWHRVTINTNSALFREVEQAFYAHQRAFSQDDGVTDVYIGFANKGNKYASDLLGEKGKAYPSDDEGVLDTAKAIDYAMRFALGDK